VATPPFDQDLSLAQRGEDLAVEQLIPNAGVDALAVAISKGEPGVMNAVFAPTAPIHTRTFLAINSAPLSDPMNAGGLRRMNRSVKASTTFVELSLRLTRITSASFMNSSMTFSVR
jgi:hypothetical protein